MNYKKSGLKEQQRLARSTGGGLLNRIRPRWLLMLSFAAAIVIGTLLLKLPFATAEGYNTSWVNALFTATSSVCVTGLIVVDTGTHFSLFGQIVVLLLLQIGGLGIMTLATFLLLLLGKRLSLRDRAVVRESLTQIHISDIGSLLKTVLRFTLLVEGIGTLLLFIRFLFLFVGQPELPLHLAVPKALYFAIFHSVSAFCNAGFSPYSESLMGFRSDPSMMAIMMTLIVIGGLGFLVVRDLGGWIKSRNSHRKGPRLMLHTRVVLITSICLLIGGTFVFHALESRHTGLDTGRGTGWISALFLSVTSRTAGFNTVDTAALANATKLIVVFLMFIGASPGSCGGGIKTSTFAIGVALIISRLRGKQHTQIGKRTVPGDIVIKALGTLTACFFLVVAVTLALTITEDRPCGEPPPSFLDLLFEATSAFGTVGLSAGVTASLSPIGKVLLILTMYAGRIGPLTLITAFSTTTAAPKIKYPEENVMIG